MYRFHKHCTIPYKVPLWIRCLRMSPLNPTTKIAGWVITTSGVKSSTKHWNTVILHNLQNPGVKWCKSHISALELRTLEIVRPFHTLSTSHLTAQFRLFLSLCTKEILYRHAGPLRTSLDLTSNTWVIESFLLPWHHLYSCLSFTPYYKQSGQRRDNGWTIVGELLSQTHVISLRFHSDGRFEYLSFGVNCFVTTIQYRHYLLVFSSASS